MDEADTAVSETPRRISSVQALEIAEADAIKAYRDLSPYRIEIALDAVGWRIDYQLKNPRLHGGGPHYVIDPRSGTIISKRYEQ